MSVNLPSVFIYKFYKKEKFQVSHQENLENNILVKFDKEIETKLNISNHCDFAVNLPIVFIYFYFVNHQENIF